MERLKIKIFGYVGSIRPSATEMIEKELIELGCDVVESEPDLLIETCGTFEKAQDYYNQCINKPCKLYNLLDINNTNARFYDQAKVDYESCEIATTISNTAKEQIEKKFQISKKIHVIGFPTRPITHLKEPKGLPFLYVGRWMDPNKRTYLIKPTIELLNRNFENELMIVSSDPQPFNCLYNNNINDEILNYIYNGAEFLFLPSKNEGIGLTSVEAILSATIPLLCQDNKTATELGLQDFTTFPSPQGFVSLIKKAQKNIQYYWKKMDELRPKFQKQFSAKTVAQNILDLYNSYKRGDL